MEKVQGFGGVLVQHFASLFLIVFGMSQALEQMPQRAVQAAVVIRQVVAEAQRRMGKEPVPEVRQAIHLGTLLVEGEPCVPSARFLAVGETSSVPVRLLGHAAPGDILVSPQVGRLIAGWYALQVREMSVATGHPGEAKALLEKLA